MKYSTIVLAGAMLLAPAGTLAVDGQVLIDQAAVNAGGGFPYLISQPGSYKLSGNLMVSDRNQTAIRIASGSVTLDLGGFAIIGPNSCPLGPCSQGIGNGIETLAGHSYRNLTIRNGVIQGMGHDGISLGGNAFLVEYLHIRGNAHAGIEMRGSTGLGATLDAATIQYCTVVEHTTGIWIEGGRIIHNNVSRSMIAIHIDRGVVEDNTLLYNYEPLDMHESVSYRGNTFAPLLASLPSEGHNMGQNLCGNALCDGDLTITSTSLPNGTVNSAYFGSVNATGGVTPYRWTLAPGSVLPAGLSLITATGAISGTPTATVTNLPLTFQVSDSSLPTPQTAQKTLSLTITASTLSITSTSLPGGTVNTAYTAALTAAGGVTPYRWSLAPGSALPNGLSLNTSGMISGTPAAIVTNLPVTFQVSDSLLPNPQTATKTLTLTITPAALSITSTSLPTGAVNSAYMGALTALGGVTPYHWSMSSVLPTGLSLNPSTGVISGTPAVTVTNLPLTFQVSDSALPTPQTAAKTLSLTIGAATLNITTLALPDGVINQPYSQQLQAAGGTSPYRWSITFSKLPPNYTLNATTGMITSTTGTCCVGVFQMGFQVTDAAQQTAAKMLTISIVDGALELLTTSLPSGNVGIPYSASLTARNGTPPYIWSMVGLLPAGLMYNSVTGQIVGIPLVAANPRLKFTVTDSSTPVPQTQSVFLNLTINAEAMTTPGRTAGGDGSW